MKWYELHTGLYPCPAINTGRKRTFENVLRCDFAINHNWIVKHNGEFIDGNSNDLGTIIELRTEDLTKVEKLFLKSTLQCWQPSCFMLNKAAKQQPETINPIICLDFDNLQDFDIDEIKQAIFDLPFVCFVSLSCSGTGIYALLLIEEPERLKQYAEHCFKVFQSYSIPIDIGKGQNPTQLRYVSYDANMLWKEHPQPLRITRHLNTPKVYTTKHTAQRFEGNAGLVEWAIKQVSSAQEGNRFDTVRKVAFTLGGYGNGLDEIEQVIKNASQYTGVEDKYLNTAKNAFIAGKLKPIQ